MMKPNSCISSSWHWMSSSLLSVFGLLLVVVLVSGCAYVKPYVPLNPTVAHQQDLTMPAVSNAIAKIDKWIEITQEQRGATSQTQRTLNLLTFGFAFGAGASSIYGAHKDTVTGLGLASAATYTGGALFAPASQATLYSTLITALVCIRTKVGVLHSIVESTEKRKTSDLKDGYPDSQIVGCTPSSEQAAAWARAENARQTLLATLDGAKSADASAANGALNAAINAIHALNVQLDLSAANSQSILEAAKASLALGAGMVTPRPTTVGNLAKGAPGEECSPKSLDNLKSIESRYQTTDRAITSALNTVGTLDTACVFNAPQITPMTVSQEEITLGKEATFNVIISGGRPPYSAQWVDTASPQGVNFQLIAPGTVVLTTTSSPSGGPYRLDVKDSSVATNLKTLKIVIK